MPNHSQMQDRYGLPLTTSSTLAAERFIEGIDLLLEQNFGPEEQFTQATQGVHHTLPILFAQFWRKRCPNHQRVSAAWISLGNVREPS